MEEQNYQILLLVEEKLQAPKIVLERLVQGRHLPKVFVEAALEEVQNIEKALKNKMIQ